MRINWKLKSSIFWVIDTFFLYRTLYFFQKYVTRRAKISIKEINKNWSIHKENLASIEKPDVIEFGAGQSLSQNIFLSNTFGSQVLVDKFQMLDIKQFNLAAQQIAKIDKREFRPPANTINDILVQYRINYKAPYDLAKSDFQENTFDACISTNTLEHIPVGNIIEIFKELKRIIRPNGLISMVIDYSDHYSHTDPSISSLNFLKFSSSEFNKYNHKIHYQNRLRHYDFETIFRGFGFDFLRSEYFDEASLPNHVSLDFNIKEDSIRYTRGIFLLKVLK